MRADLSQSPSRSARIRALAVLAACLGALCALLLSAEAPAKDLEAQLEAKQAKLEKAREKRGVLSTTIARYDDRISRLTAEVAALRTREAAVRARLARKQVELERAQARLDVAKRHLAVLRARLKRALVVLRERLVAIYESGSPDLLTVILGSDGYEDLVQRTEYLNRIRGMDDAVVGRVRDLRDSVKRTVNKLRAVKDRIKAARDAIAAEERQLAQARAAVQKRQATLVAARAKRRRALARIDRRAEKLEGSVAKIQAQLQARLQGTASAPLPAGPIRGGSGGLIWPVNGPVVSGFGWRFGGSEMHPGIDIAVPSGTAIRAAASGTVIFTQPESASGGYGNFTCIDHGGGLSTCYAHQSSFAVSAGERVSQGEVIGYSDCTGYCFGPHVHFEVRIDGAPTDPMAYL